MYRVRFGEQADDSPPPEDDGCVETDPTSRYARVSRFFFFWIFFFFV